MMKFFKTEGKRTYIILAAMAVLIFGGVVYKTTHSLQHYVRNSVYAIKGSDEMDGYLYFQSNGKVYYNDDFVTEKDEYKDGTAYRYTVNKNDITLKDDDDTLKIKVEKPQKQSMNVDFTIDGYTVDRGYLMRAGEVR